MMQTKIDLYKDIATRTGGDIYIGVVGPVRSGKSTFIKRFMESLVLPNIESEFRRERAIDELPQSAAGKTIMTTEPKFIPEEAIRIEVEAGTGFNVRMIDCVGYIVPSAIGYIENEQPRMVDTPWFDQEIPFNMAAEVGTRKVITEHSTVGIVVTTDGSISDIPREEYEEAEERVIEELTALGKPFVVLLNALDPSHPDTLALAEELGQRYEVPVLPINCLDVDEEQIRGVLTTLLYQFPMKEISFEMPRWINQLEAEHWLKKAVFDRIKQSATHLTRIDQMRGMSDEIATCEYVDFSTLRQLDLGSGSAVISVNLLPDLFLQIISEQTGLEVAEESALLPLLLEFAQMKQDYGRFKTALDEVEATGYGIVMPSRDQLRVEEPEIVKQGGKYGVRLRAQAPSIHMVKCDITTEVSPIVGSESQSEDLVLYLLDEFNEDPKKIWESNIFGKTLNELVNEGLHNKLYRMPMDARMKLQETIERVINEGCSGLICIIL